MPDPVRPGLAGDEVTGFQRDGVVLPRGALAPALVARLAGAVEIEVAATTGPAAAGFDRLCAIGADAASDPLAAWAREARLAELLEPLIGAGAPWGCAALFIAEPAGALVPWHQDGAGWPLAAVETVSVRVALDRVDRANGCMRLLPRPHERLVREIRNLRDRLRLALPPDRVDPAIVIEAARERGQLTVYDGRTFYCEPANRSRQRRAAVVFRYRAAGPARASAGPATR